MVRLIRQRQGYWKPTASAMIHNAEKSRAANIHCLRQIILRLMAEVSIVLDGSTNRKPAGFEA